MIPKIAAAIAAGLVGMGGLSVAGALPDQIENAVADVANVVGLEHSAKDDDRGKKADDDDTVVSQETDAKDSEAEDKADNFGDVVHDAKEAGATGQDIADLAHERNAERRDERDNPGLGHDQTRDDEVRADAGAAADDAGDEDEDEDAEDQKHPGRGRGLDD